MDFKINILRKRIVILLSTYGMKLHSPSITTSMLAQVQGQALRLVAYTLQGRSSNKNLLAATGACVCTLMHLTHADPCHVHIMTLVILVAVHFRYAPRTILVASHTSTLWRNRTLCIETQNEADKVSSIRLYIALSRSPCQVYLSLRSELLITSFSWLRLLLKCINVKLLRIQSCTTIAT